MSLAKQQCIAACHVIDAASKQQNTSIVLHRHAWLQSATIPEDARMHIEDLPFDGVGLFNGKTDDILNDLQKMRRTARSYNTQSSYRPYKQQWHRPYGQSYNTYQSSRFPADRDRSSFASTSFGPRQQQSHPRPNQPFRRLDRKPRQNF